MTTLNIHGFLRNNEWRTFYFYDRLKSNNNDDDSDQIRYAVKKMGRLIQIENQFYLNNQTFDGLGCCLSGV